jgi:hypothetical protein
VNQLWLAQHGRLSPWSGGGFGMFSTTDSPAHRHLHAFVANESVMREVRLPEAWQERVLRVTTLPSRERVAALASDIAALESGGAVRWDQVTVQVWAVDYDPVTLVLSGRLLRSERVDIDDAQ